MREGSGRAVAALAVDADSGRLRPVEGSPLILDDAERSRTSCFGQGRLAIDDTGAFLVSSNCRADSLEVLRIDPVTGALRRFPGSPFATRGSPRSVTLYRPR